MKITLAVGSVGQEYEVIDVISTTQGDDGATYAVVQVNCPACHVATVIHVKVVDNSSTDYREVEE